MGKKGREIVKLNVQEIIDDLNRAYADEWLAGYYYRLAAILAAGINAPTVADMLKNSSTSELSHADRIAERIIQLGGEPIRNFGQLESKANCPEFRMPEDPRDMEGILRAVLETERSAIGVYESLLNKAQDKDVVTYELIEELLVEEVADEEEVENLLGM